MDAFKTCCPCLFNPKWEDIIKEDLKWSMLSKIGCFFYSMREDQWINLEKRISDVSINILLAKLLMEFIIELSRECHECLATTGSLNPFNKSRFLHEMLIQSFKDILEVGDEVVCTSAKHLIDIIRMEVSENVNSSDRKEEHAFILKHVVPLETLNSMVHHASIMLWEFTAKMNPTSKCQVRRKKMALSNKLVPVVDPEDPDNVTSDSQPESEGEDIKCIKAMILREGNKAIGSLLNDTSERHSSFRRHVPLDICENVLSMKDTFEQATLKMFFEEWFIETWLNRIQDQIQAKYRDAEYRPILVDAIKQFMPKLVNLAGDTPNKKVYLSMTSVFIRTCLKDFFFERIQIDQNNVNHAAMSKEIFEEVYIFMNILNFFNNCEVDWMVESITQAFELIKSQSSNVLSKAFCTPELQVDPPKGVPPKPPSTAAQDNKKRTRMGKFFSRVGQAFSHCTK